MNGNAIRGVDKTMYSGKASRLRTAPRFSGSRPGCMKDPVYKIEKDHDFIIDEQALAAFGVVVHSATRD